MAFRRSGVRAPLAPPTTLIAGYCDPSPEWRGVFLTPGATPHRDRHHRTHRANPDRAVQRRLDRTALAGEMGRGRVIPDRPARHVPAEVLPPDDVRLPVGGSPHRPLVRKDTDRRHRALPPDARRQRLLPP